MAVAVSISIDTEEDDWSRYTFDGATTRNIAHLVELQDLFGSFGARPTYLVNRPPLMAADAVDVLGRLSTAEAVEIGGHCHPWNTLRLDGEAADRSMMFRLDTDVNRALVREVTNRIESELGVRPTTFRAGRWGWGANVADALWKEGYQVDSSVTPLLDWSSSGGPDYSRVPRAPYRFQPGTPLQSDAAGPLVEIPITVGFLRGNDAGLGPVRTALERRLPRRLGVVGALDRMGLLARRWLSPEVSSGQDMIRLAENLVERGRDSLNLTFHSSALLPGATPFVRDAADRKRFLSDIRSFLRFADEAGFEFRTLGELATEIPRAPS